MDQFGGYKTEVKERIEIRERLALKEKMEGEEHLRDSWKVKRINRNENVFYTAQWTTRKR